MKHNSQFLCAIHDLKFSAEIESAESHLVRCPLCLNKENKELRAEVERLLIHRNALLEAIEIKQTVTLYTGRR